MGGRLKGWCKQLFSLPFKGYGKQPLSTIELLKELDAIEVGFTEVNVRFSDNLARLENIAHLIPKHLPEDFGRFRQLALPLYTRSSGMAITLVDDLVFNGAEGEVEDYFNLHSQGRPRPFLDWYSNKDSLTTFLQNVPRLLNLYRAFNPKVKDDTYSDSHTKLNAAHWNAGPFFKDRCFKLLVLDSITVFRLVLNEELRGTHDQREKKP